MSRLRPLLALAWRESRFARRRLLLFLSSISLGVAALVATQGFAANLAGAVRDQSRALLGADVRLESSRPFAPEAEALLDSLERAGYPAARSLTFASVALLPRAGTTRLAQVRAVGPGFPVYGRVETEPADAWAALGEEPAAVVDPALLTSLGARVGDTLALGEGRFRIAGTAERIPGESGIGSVLAPRVFIPLRTVEGTGLIGFGSRVEHSAFLRLPGAEARAALEEAYAPALREARVRLTTVEEQERELGAALERLGDYLGLVGVFALLLGGIGVASAMGAYMARKRETVATLRCLGATAPQVLAVYALQAAAMGLAGAGIGAAAGLAVQWLLPRLASGLLPVDVRVAPDPASLAAGVGVGLWIAVAFALLPLVAARRVPPLRALRRRVEEPPREARRDPLAWAARALLAASVVGLVVLEAGAVGFGLGLAAGIAATLGALAGVAWLVIRGLRRLSLPGLPYPARQGLANLRRPGNQTSVVVLALGFGVFLLATLWLVQESLLRPLRPEAAAGRADLVVFDVQQERTEEVRALLREAGATTVQEAAIVPMRVAAVNGVRVADLLPDRTDAGEAAEEPRRERPEDGGDGERRPERWALRREYRSTYRDTLVRTEVLTEGRFWSPGATAGADGVAEVSLEEGIADDLGVEVGDRITWDVQGVEVPTRVTSLRAVDWQRPEPNFFAVFPSEVLEAAPQTRIFMARADSAEARAVVQREVAARFPGAIAVDITRLQEALDEVVGRVALVIRFLAGFSLATGFVVLLGAVATSRLQRVRESVLLRTLGATEGQVRAILLVEYAALGLAAAVSGAGLAVGAGWLLAGRVFGVDYGVPAAPLLGLAAATAALAALIGLAASREVFRRTPLEALREES